MKYFVLFLVATSFWSVALAQYSQTDYSIFDLKDSLEKLAPNDTFYSILGVEKSADFTELTKAYRKKSLQLHPDKNPDKESNELYALVTSIITILKDPESRERYDHFLYNGFPVWRGTGYYYRRFKPGLGFACVFVTCFIAVVQYLTSWVYYIQNKSTVNELNRAIDEIQYKQFKSSWKKAYGKDKVPQQEFEKHKREYVAELLQIDLDHLEQLETRPSIFDTIVFSLLKKLSALVLTRKKVAPPVSHEPAPMSRSSSVVSNVSVESYSSSCSTSSSISSKFARNKKHL